MAIRLTDALIKKLAPAAAGQQYLQFDSETTGLAVRVTGGSKSIILDYRFRGKQRRMTIGRWPEWAVSAARTRASELRRLIDQGIDPLEQEATARAESVTVADFWWRVYEPHHVATRRPSWARDVRSMMARDVLPRLGKRLVKEIDHADAAALHRAITKRAPSRANRTIAVLSHLMSYVERPHVAEDGEKIPALRAQGSNPCRGIARNPEDRRERFLSPAELGRLAEALERHPGRNTANLVRFLLLTGCRFGEATTATWSQFDVERGTWTKPSSHTKQKRSHTTPLSAPALALVAEMKAANGSSPYLFPGPTGKPITTIKTAWRSICRQAGLDEVRVHDLRHSFASVLAAGGASLVLIGQLLGHTQAATTQRYTHLVDAVQREAVERAAAVIMGQPGAEVVPLRRAQQ